MIDRGTAFLMGVAMGVLLLAAAMTVAPDHWGSPRLSCAVKSADGCMVWQDKRRVDAYKLGRAGQ